MQASTPEIAGASRPRLETIKLVTVVSGCNFLEMYAFMAFGYYAPWIARAFFPTSSDFAALMLTLATFGTGFLMRPVGAVLLGAYMDRRGRRAGLLLTLGLMATGTVLLGCTPKYQTLGVFAPMIALLSCSKAYPPVQASGAHRYIFWRLLRPEIGGFTWLGSPPASSCQWYWHRWWASS